ncbi:MAG: hypothetical protein PHQ69_04360 [Bacteroidales bacterium]|nr:hypothetical protein [Bacteroidales bacterium]
MERKSNFLRLKQLIILILLISGMSVGAQKDPLRFRRTIYTSYISGNMEQWKQEINTLQLQAREEVMQRELLIAEYGYIAWSLGNGRKREAKQYLETASQRLDALFLAYPDDAELLALKGAFLGFEMDGAFYKAPFLGPKSLHFITGSVSADSLAPHGFIQAGNAKYYLPPALGGSKTEALLYYETAEKNYQPLFQENPYDWRYLNLLIQMANVYEALNKINEAEKTYQKIVRLAPSFSWVRDELYPAFIQRTQNTN